MGGGEDHHWRKRLLIFLAHLHGGGDAHRSVRIDDLAGQLSDGEAGCRRLLVQNLAKMLQVAKNTLQSQGRQRRLVL